MAEAIFSTTNRWVFHHHPLLIAQVIAMALVGASGGLLRGCYAFQLCPPTGMAASSAAGSNRTYRHFAL